ncbi:MAG: hypothetical protein FWH57_08780 [Oscillospiraceae bacterium]|nr:hypothetical protein [Oscillospiraceae bacterium]
MKFWHYIILIMAALLLLGFFFLPNAVAEVSDSRSLGNLVMIDSQRISFDSTSELSLPERIALAANPKAGVLPVETGNAMDDGMAKETIGLELLRFFKDSLFQFDFNEYDVEEGAAMLIVDADLPSRNLIVWEFVIIDRAENKITVTLDDETGIILRLIYRLGNQDNTLIGEEEAGSPGDEFYSMTQRLVEMMKDYYELPITLADYQFRGRIAFYRADLFSGGRAIPMYGAVRPASFTMNERV